MSIYTSLGIVGHNSYRWSRFARFIFPQKKSANKHVFLEIKKSVQYEFYSLSYANIYDQKHFWLGNISNTRDRIFLSIICSVWEQKFASSDPRRGGIGARFAAQF